MRAWMKTVFTVVMVYDVHGGPSFEPFSVPLLPTPRAKIYTCTVVVI